MEGSKILGVLALLWAAGMLAWSVKQAQEGAAVDEGEPEFFRATKSDAGEGARAKPEAGKVGKKGTVKKDMKDLEVEAKRAPEAQADPP